jgi:4-alpha-glucanotransferase
MDAWGVADGYWDFAGEWHVTTEQTRRAIHDAMHATGERPRWAPSWSVVEGESPGLQSLCELTLEDGTDLPPTNQLPPDLPIGYHSLRPLDDGPVTRLVVRPRACPAAPFGWGWSTQLASLRSAASWGIGDLADLRSIAAWTRRRGGVIVQVSPLHAPAPVAPVQPSPYYPSSRRWRNVLHIAVRDVPGVTAVAGDLAALDRRGRALLDDDVIERDAVLTLKLRALEELFAAQPQPDAFHRWRAEQGDDLEQWGTYCALAEEHGPGWPVWPDALRHPAAAEVRSAARARAARVSFHAWCQWVAEEQLQTAATAGAGLLGDLAVGFDAGGFDAWSDQDLLALGCRVGAPPDGFAPDGQDWGIPPYIPWKLRDAEYRPLIDTIRSALRGMLGLRIDHVMGLSRLFWIPVGLPPPQGAYVNHTPWELMDIVAVEAHRAGAFVVGEDLGTVEPALREAMRERHVLGTVLAIFEDDPPAQWRPDAVVALDTHDLPTAAGLLTGADEASIARLRRRVDQFELRQRVEALAAPGGGVRQSTVRAHRALATAPARLVVASLDDAIGMLRRANVPGTIDEWPNWRIPLPVRLEDLDGQQQVGEVIAALADGRAERASADAEHRGAEEAILGDVGQSHG